MSGILNYACCCGGGQITTCPEWTACRPQEIWLSYSYSATYSRVAVPQAGATGAGGLLEQQTEAFQGTVKFIRHTGLETGCGGVVLNPMVDYAGDFTYTKTVVTNRFFDPADATLCPSLCALCVEIVPSQRVQAQASRSWSNLGTPAAYGDNAIIQCTRCFSAQGAQGYPQGWVGLYHKANFAVGTTNYRCNGTVSSTSSSTLVNHHAPTSVFSRPQCLNASAFGQYHITRDTALCADPAWSQIPPIPYPYCVTPPEPCDAQGGIVYRESDSVNDCYQLACVNRGCFNPSLFYGCGCDSVPACDNPFPPAGNNGCYDEHLEYTMSSSVTVTNVIP